jgi:hypothetical protein
MPESVSSPSPGSSLPIEACLGAIVAGLPLGGSLLLQFQLQGQWPQAGLHILLAQTLLTALLAPMICSLLLLRWRQVASLRG